MTRDKLLASHPDFFFLDPVEPELLAAYLRGQGVLLSSDNVVLAERAGDGNMNSTVRVASSSGARMIVKQSRPWVEKYPQFEAPWDRAVREMEFYELAGTSTLLSAQLPEILLSDASNRLIVMEDLGKEGGTTDCTDVFKGGRFTTDEVATLGRFLSLLHREFQGSAPLKAITNREMRALNHAHIFDIPYQEENGLDLDTILSGLVEVAGPYKQDSELRDAVNRLGSDVYLADPDSISSLVHGDFFPGSFLRVESGLKIIDPEFSYGGRAEFDTGVFLAHLVLARQPYLLVNQFLDAYAAPNGHDEALMLQFAGVEIIRRIIGYAQLPLAASLGERAMMLAKARALVLEPMRALLLE